MAIRAKLRPIGTSLGIIIPKKELDSRRFKAGDILEIPKILRPGPKDLFGTWKENPAKVGEVRS